MPIADPVCEPNLLNPKQIGLVRHHLDEITASHAFVGSKRTQDFLHLIIEHALAGDVDALRERMIGAEMFGRPVDYDTGSDSVVRVKATEVRKRLAQYYLEADKRPAVRIELPIGSYVPKFIFDPLETTIPPQNGNLPPVSVQQNSAQSPMQLAEGLQASEIAPPRSSPPKQLRTPRFLIGAALALALLAVIGYALFRQNRAGSNAGEIRSIAILPLQNLSGDPAQDYFADGMTEELINDLGQVSTLRVISLTSAMSYKGTKKKLPEIARELAVDGIVEGGVQRAGDQVRISAQLIDARTDRPVWGHTYVRDMTSVLAQQGEVAQAIADEIRTNVTPQEQARLARMRLVDPVAQDYYLHGTLRFNSDDCKNAIDDLNKAIAISPNYAPAHAALAACWGRLGESGQMAYKDAFSQQKAEAVKAIGLDDSLPPGHAELANASMTLDWDWATAQTEFHRALQLDPNSAPLHERYAFYLARTGQMREALSEEGRGVDLDPASPRTFHNEGFIYYFCRQYDQALALIHTVRALDIDLPDWNFLLGDVYAEKGMYQDAIRAFIRSGDGPYSLGHLGNAYARAGQTDEALKMISRLQERVRKDGVGRYEIAMVYIGLGRKNDAFKWLDEACKSHDVGLLYLKIDPPLDPLRSDPRFNDLVRRVGLMK
ncbi:MAG: tetratricopeptide repeat protein [Terracidiphilus sp.]|jgi:TolB-like protein